MRLLAKVSALDGLSGSLLLLLSFQPSLEFGCLGASHLECAGLTALCWPAGLMQVPTADASKNSQQAFQVHFEDKSLRNVRFRDVANFWSSFGGAVKPAPMKAASSRRTPRSLSPLFRRPGC